MAVFVDEPSSDGEVMGECGAGDGAGPLQKIDAEGRMWVAEAADPQLLAAAREAYDRAMVEAEPSEEDGTRESEADCTEAEVIELQTWDSTDCDADGHTDIHVFDDGVGRGEAMAPGESLWLEYTALFDLGPAGDCSAIFVGDNEILTNAHCVMDADTLNPFNMLNMSICTRGNFETDDPMDMYEDPVCWTGITAVITEGYTGTNDINDDFALVRFNPHSWSTPVSYVARYAPATMPISTAGPSTVEAADVMRIGYPKFDNVCTDGWQVPGFHATPDLGVIGLETVNDDPVTISAHRIKTKMDCAGGDSGSAYFYEPVLGSPAIVGLHASWNVLETYCGGPRASEFRDFVIANL